MWLFFIAAMVADSPAMGQAQSAEARPLLQARFERIDRDRNGYITANEAPRIAQARCDCASPADPSALAPGWIRNYDADGDLRVSAAEFLAGPMARSSSNLASQR